MVANTVSRTENLWLTTMTRKGSNLSLEGSSASVNAVANFITALKRSGYFQKVEIKETKQDDKTTSVETFNFQISAEITPPQVGPAAPSQAKPASTPSKSTPSATPDKKG
jgi:Tfp pilus assembly protein PilN